MFFPSMPPRRKKHAREQHLQKNTSRSSPSFFTSSWECSSSFRSSASFSLAPQHPTFSKANTASSQQRISKRYTNRAACNQYSKSTSPCSLSALSLHSSLALEPCSSSSSCGTDLSGELSLALLLRLQQSMPGHHPHWSSSYSSLASFRMSSSRWEHISLPELPEKTPPHSSSLTRSKKKCISSNYLILALSS